MRNLRQHKMASSRWTWDEEKTDAFLLATRNYKRQKLGEGIEWDSDKVLMWEHIRKSLGVKWETDFGKAEPSNPMKQLADVTKDEYQNYVQELRQEKEVISTGLRRVKNKYKGNK